MQKDLDRSLRGCVLYVHLGHLPRELQPRDLTIVAQKVKLLIILWLLFIYNTKWINESYTRGCISKIKAREDKFSHWDNITLEKPAMERSKKWDWKREVAPSVFLLSNDQSCYLRIGQSSLVTQSKK